MPPDQAWLLFSMQLPAQPAYLRVKLWRRLREAGAVSVSGGSHLLPDQPRHRLFLRDVAEQAHAGGGHAITFAGIVLDGVDEPSALFRAARAADYEKWIADIDHLLKAEVSAADVRRMRQRLDRLTQIEFTDTGMSDAAGLALQKLEAASLRHPDVTRELPGQAFSARELHGRVWVTRRGIGVDRIASAWLIRRFIDPRPRFRFVDPDRYVHQRRELRFDMADGEFTHEGDRCSFETLVDRATVGSDPALGQIAQAVHELDIEDGRYDSPGLAGLATAIAEICRSHRRDGDRLSHGSAMLDELYDSLRVTSGR